MGCAGTPEILLDLGRLPLALSWRKDRAEPVRRHRLQLSRCSRCGLLQLSQPPADELLVPPVPLRLAEPEEHLDVWVRQLAALAPARVLGTSWIDESALARWPSPTHGLIAPDHLSPELLSADLAGRRLGPADLIICRYLLEHAWAPRELLASLSGGSGRVALEVPDCTPSLAGLNYPTLWEAHRVYFTPSTFQRSLTLAGYRVEALESHPAPLDRALTALVQPGAGELDDPDDPALVERFVASYPRVQAETRDALWRLKQQHGPVALLGAGHLASLFIHQMGVEELISLVVDDHPLKQGAWMPGLDLPILPTKTLETEGYRLCLLGLSPNREQAVVERLQGVRCLSIFPQSQRYLLGAAA